MSFKSVKEMMEAAEAMKLSLPEAILRNDMAETSMSREKSIGKMEYLWDVMLQTSRDYDAGDRSNSGLTGGKSEKVRQAAENGRFIGDAFLADVMQEALKTSECNACMKRIVASPTAGSCGVLPGVLIPLYHRHENDPDFERKIIESMYVAAGFGGVTAERASVSGAEGGCQAEIGTASAMSAAALTWIYGGTADQCADAFAIALTNLLGLVCDPVAGLVEVPCVNRNAAGAVVAVTSANMALAGICSEIPADEVIDAMKEVGDVMSSDLRETGIGGLAGSPTGQELAKQILGVQSR